MLIRRKFLFSYDVTADYVTFSNNSLTS